MFRGISIVGAFQGILRVGRPGTHFFLAAPSPLFLLFFKFVVVSIVVSEVSIVVETALVLDFFLTAALDAGSTGCSVMLAGMGAVTDVGMKTGVDADVDVGSAFLAGEAVADLFSAFFGGDSFFSSHFCPSFFCFLGLGMIRFFFRCFSFTADGGCGDCFLL